MAMINQNSAVSAMAWGVSWVSRSLGWFLSDPLHSKTPEKQNPGIQNQGEETQRKPIDLRRLTGSNQLR